MQTEPNRDESVSSPTVKPNVTRCDPSSPRRILTNTDSGYTIRDYILDAGLSVKQKGWKPCSLPHSPFALVLTHKLAHNLFAKLSLLALNIWAAGYLFIAQVHVALLL